MLSINPVWPQDDTCRKSLEAFFFSFSGAHFWNKCLPTFSTYFAKALHWIIQWHIPLPQTLILTIFYQYFSFNRFAYVDAVSWMQRLGKQLGVQFKKVRNCVPCTCLNSLAIKLDSAKMEASFPKLEHFIPLQLLSVLGVRNAPEHSESFSNSSDSCHLLAGHTLLACALIQRLMRFHQICSSPH